MGVIVPDLKSTTIATALRDDILKHAWGRPESGYVMEHPISRLSAEQVLLREGINSTPCRGPRYY